MPYSILNFLFSPLFSSGSFNPGALISTSILAFFISLVFVILNKVLINQKEMEDLKKKHKEFKIKADEARKKNDVKEMNKITREMLEVNHRMMKMTLKPTLASILVVFLFLPWLPSTFSPTIELIKNDNGIYEGKLPLASKIFGADTNLTEINVTLSNSEVKFGDFGEASEGEYVEINSDRWEIKSVNIGDEKTSVKLSLEFIPLPFSLPLVGKSIEWLGFYFMISIISTIILRKIFGLK